MALIYFYKALLVGLEARQRKLNKLNEFRRLDRRHLEDIGLFEFKRCQLIQQGWGRKKVC